MGIVVAGVIPIFNARIFFEEILAFLECKYIPGYPATCISFSI